MNIYVSNLSFNVQDEDLKGFFEDYGEVTSARVITDKFTQRSKGFGFVEMSDDAAAAKAIAELDGSTADGRTMKVMEAGQKKTDPLATSVLSLKAGNNHNTARCPIKLPGSYSLLLKLFCMTNDLIEKFIESKEMNGKPVNIFFKQRNAITGLFIQWNDYEEMKAKNFWRIVTESKIDEWRQTKDVNLAKLFSGTDFSRLK